MKIEIQNFSRNDKFSVLFMSKAVSIIIVM